MTRRLLTGNTAAAWACRLARCDYIPAFPITPQTEIIETLAGWIETGEVSARLCTLESEHSMITAAGAAAAVGVRVFSATSSQGLLHAMEMLYSVAGWRVPFVLVNVSRGLAAPITLEPDHNDVLAARDSGFLQIHCASCQEVLDSTLIAYRLAEDPRVRLPALVNMDGFYLSFTREPVEVPDQASVDAFLPPHASDASRQPASHGVAVLGGSAYSYFRYQAHLAAIAALDVYPEIADAYAAQCGRTVDLLEAYRTDDAEYVFVMIGSFATKARQAVDQLRESGARVGLVRPLMVRPFPVARLRAALRGKRGVAVIDQNISIGGGGVLYAELAAALYRVPGAPALVSFIGGLGGRDISSEELFEIIEATRRAAVTSVVPPPRLLFTEGELADVRRLQAVAVPQPERGEA